MTREEAVAAYGTRQPRETPRDRLWSVVLVLAIVVFLGGLVDLLQYFQVEEVQRFQREGRERTYETRAVACAGLLAEGVDLPPPCLIPEVAAYYDLTP